MKIIDANIVLYAVNQHSPHHLAVKAWWEKAVDDGEPLGLSWTALLGFLRVATHPRAFVQPLAPIRAIEIVEEWLAHPNIRIVAEAENHWEVLRSLLIESGTAGNLTTDAHLAALAISRGAVLVSCDADFSRFRQLRWENPLTTA
jgi:toxin-antitoxin system PIN domain toxin